jgi:hypothetical protein
MVVQISHIASDSGDDVFCSIAVRLGYPYGTLLHARRKRIILNNVRGALKTLTR